jgi:hypothetical protein
MRGGRPVTFTSMEMGRGNQGSQVTWESDRTAVFVEDISIFKSKNCHVVLCDV